MTLLIKGGTVVALDDAGASATVSDVLIEGNRISAIGVDLPAQGAETIDATGAIVMPGLVDSHTHAWQYAWRNALSRVWGFRDYVGVFESYRGRYEAADVYDSVRGCSLAQLDAGVTGVIDFLHGANQTPEHADAAFRAHASTGQRTLLAIGNTAPNGVDADEFERSRLERIESVRRLSGENGLVRVGLGLLTPTAETMPRVLDEIDAARGLGVRMTVHQNRPGEISALHESGRLGPDLIAVHSSSATDDELAMLAAAGAPLSTTPQSEVGAAWSMSVLRRAIRLGVRLSVGIDTPSTVTVDLWQQIRVLQLLLTMLDGEDARRLGRYPLDSELDPPTLGYEGVLSLATSGGAHALTGADDLGVLRTGSIADVIVVRPNDPDAAAYDAAPYLVQAGSPDQVEAVIVDGVVRKQDGALLDVDQDELAHANRAVRDRILRGSA